MLSCINIQCRLAVSKIVTVEKILYFCPVNVQRSMVYLVSARLSVQAQMTLKHAQAELKTKQAEMKKMDSGYKKDQDSLHAVRSSREKLQAELAKLNYEGCVCVFCMCVYV